MILSDVAKLEEYLKGQKRGHELLNAVAQSILLAQQEGPSNYVRPQADNFRRSFW